MNDNARPVVFLAFANDRSGEGGYLRNLPEEARQLHAVLDAAARAGRCEVLMHQNVTVDTVLDLFDDARYRNRVAAFHHGGHADSDELLLETAETVATVFAVHFYRGLAGGGGSVTAFQESEAASRRAGGGQARGARRGTLAVGADRGR